MLTLVLLAVAVVCFIAAALSVRTNINLTAVGLACFAASFWPL